MYFDDERMRSLFIFRWMPLASIFLCVEWKCGCSWGGCRFRRFGWQLSWHQSIIKRAFYRGGGKSRLGPKLNLPSCCDQIVEIDNTDMENKSMAGGMAGGIGLPHITRPKKRAPRSIPVIKHTTPDIQVSSNTTHQQCQLASFQKNYQKACLADKCIQTKAISNRIILDFRLNIHIMVYAKHNFHFLPTL